MSVQTSEIIRSPFLIHPIYTPKKLDAPGYKTPTSFPGSFKAEGKILAAARHRHVSHPKPIVLISRHDFKALASHTPRKYSFTKGCSVFYMPNDYLRILDFQSRPYIMLLLARGKLDSQPGSFISPEDFERPWDTRLIKPFVLVAYFGFTFNFLNPIHWFQFADDAAVITGQDSENQHLLNRFSI